MTKAGHLFTSLISAADGQQIARTTRPLEGEISVGLKDILRDHRLSEDHAISAIDWHL